MSKQYILIDFMNLVFRSKHKGHGDLNDKIGLSFHIVLNSIKNCAKEFGDAHVVLCLEGRSWRRDYYNAYKRNRKITQMAKPIQEQEDDKVFLEAIGELTTFLKEKTNVTVLHTPVTEADDMISFWIDYHKNDKHIIVSSDSDYIQLLSENVSIFNGVTEEKITINGYFDKKGKPIIDKKTRTLKEIPEPKWELFKKCIRGDSSDFIKSAYPGITMKSTKSRIGIREAYEDKEKQGYAYSNFMLQRWVNENNEEQRVKECYEFNEFLVDLTRQPEEIKEVGRKAIEEAINKPKIRNVGIAFMRFCALWDLVNLSKYPTEMVNILNTHYSDTKVDV